MTESRSSDQGSAANGRRIPADEQDDPLVLYGHRIVPTVKQDGSVRRWQCLDCEAEATSVEAYLDLDCEPDE